MLDGRDEKNQSVFFVGFCKHILGFRYLRKIR